MKTKDLIRQVALAQPEHVCEWHIDPPCGSPGRTRVNFEDGPGNVCAQAAEEIKKSYPEAVSNEVDLKW
jgi:hypothetical protein